MCLGWKKQFGWHLYLKYSVIELRRLAVVLKRWNQDVVMYFFPLRLRNIVAFSRTKRINWRGKRKVGDGKGLWMVRLADWSIERGDGKREWGKSGGGAERWEQRWCRSAAKRRHNCYEQPFVGWNKPHKFFDICDQYRSFRPHFTNFFINGLKIFLTHSNSYTCYFQSWMLFLSCFFRHSPLPEHCRYQNKQMVAKISAALIFLIQVLATIEFQFHRRSKHCNTSSKTFPSCQYGSSRK